jgi:hypothetical protein
VVLRLGSPRALGDHPFLSYPFTWSITLLNLFINRSQLQDIGAEKWYWLGLAFSAAHMLYGKKAIGLLNRIKQDVPKGNSTQSMAESGVDGFAGLGFHDYGASDSD